MSCFLQKQDIAPPQMGGNLVKAAAEKGVVLFEGLEKARGLCAHGCRILPEDIIVSIVFVCLA